jgi:glycosyltransferase involved in cell wall biosynthesis
MEPLLGLGGTNARRLKAKLPRRALELAGRAGLGADRLLACELFHGVFPGVPRLSKARRTLALSEFPPAQTQLGGYDAVITFSTWAADEIAQRFGLARERVHALPVGCEHWKRELAIVPARAEPALVLVLGRLAHSRAPTAVLAACERLRARGLACQLSFVGRRGDAYDELRARVTRSPMSASVRFDSEPDERTLPATVARAFRARALERGRALASHASRSAGVRRRGRREPRCGLRGGARRARALDRGRARETDVDELATAIAAALDDARDERASRARAELAARFTWERHARLTLELWRRILSRS